MRNYVEKTFKKVKRRI